MPTRAPNKALVSLRGRTAMRATSSLNGPLSPVRATNLVLICRRGPHRARVEIENGIDAEIKLLVF